MRHSRHLTLFSYPSYVTFACPRTTQMVRSMGSTSVYHNTVPANSTPRTRQSSARLSSGHHSSDVLVPVCKSSNIVPHAHSYSPRLSCSPALLSCSRLSFVSMLLPCHTRTPTSIYSDYSATRFRASYRLSSEISSHDIQRTLASLLLVPCFKFVGHISFRNPTFFGRHPNERSIHPMYCKILLLQI